MNMITYLNNTAKLKIYIIKALTFVSHCLNSCIKLGDKSYIVRNDYIALFYINFITQYMDLLIKQMVVT